MVQRFIIFFTFSSRRGCGQTLRKSAANLHGAIPLAILASEELVVALQSVALVAEVLDDCFLGESVAGRWVAAVAPVLWFGGG